MKSVNLGELGEFKNGVNFNSVQMGRGFPLINVKDITNSHRIEVKDLDLVEVKTNDEMFAKESDLFFARSSVKLDGIALTAKLMPSDMKAIHCGFVIRFRPTCTDLSTDYLLYLLKSREYRERLKGLSGGAAIVNISQGALKGLSIPMPSLSQQHRIADILSTYDDLIENNRRRIQLLEESAQLLYKEWFVHLRFPGHEHVKIVDGVPEGWEKKPLAELAQITMGQSPKSEFYNETEDGLPFHQGVTNYGDRFVTNKIYCTKPTRLAEAGDILCSVRAPVGRLNITLDKMIVGRGLCACRSKTNNQSFLYYQLKNYFFKEDIMGSGAIFAAVTKKDMENLPLLTPSSERVKDFEEVSLPIDGQIERLDKQNKLLSEARDILLPRLMNGEVAV